MEREEKLKALDAAIAKLEKEYGKGAVMKLGDPASQMNVETGYCRTKSIGTHCRCCPIF